MNSALQSGVADRRLVDLPVAEDLSDFVTVEDKADRIDDGTCALASRSCLLNLSIGYVEDERRAGVRRGKGPQRVSPNFQICLPYRGLFVLHVGGDDVVGDANQVVFLSRGESFRMTEPIPEGYAGIIISPDLDVLGEITQLNRLVLADHPAFKRRSRRAGSRLQNLRTRFLHWVRGAPAIDALEAEELVLVLLRSTLEDDKRCPRSHGATTARLIRRTKEYLQEQLSNRLQLVDVGRVVGASPAYLTDLFRRVEGLPLHRYLTHLRLARALVELPHTEDITALALNLGFSSHSHFSYVFRRAFGSTPSQFRESTRRALMPRLA